MNKKDNFQRHTYRRPYHPQLDSHGRDLMGEWGTYSIENPILNHEKRIKSESRGKLERQRCFPQGKSFQRESCRYKLGASSGYDRKVKVLPIDPLTSRAPRLMEIIIEK